jgi:hypothetical protein
VPGLAEVLLTFDAGPPQLINIDVRVIKTIPKMIRFI